MMEVKESIAVNKVGKLWSFQVLWQVMGAPEPEARKAPLDVFLYVVAALGRASVVGNKA